MTIQDTARWSLGFLSQQFALEREGTTDVYIPMPKGQLFLFYLWRDLSADQEKLKGMFYCSTPFALTREWEFGYKELWCLPRGFVWAGLPVYCVTFMHWYLYNCIYCEKTVIIINRCSVNLFCDCTQQDQLKRRFLLLRQQGDQLVSSNPCNKLYWQSLFYDG